MLILVFILGRQRQVQEKKVHTHAWRGWRKVEEDGTDTLDHDQELEASESESKSSLDFNEFVNFDKRGNLYEEREQNLDKVQEPSEIS